MSDLVWRRTGLLAFLFVAISQTARSGGPPTSPPRLPELVLLSPGTPIGSEPPRGWSTLVLKSMPRLESGDLDTLPSFAGSTATLFRSVIFADIRRTGDSTASYRLARIGLGLCVPQGTKETVVSREYVAAGHISLGLIERQVLEHAEDELKKARLIACGPRFAVLATPSSLLVGKRQESVHLLYAFCVDSTDGRLDAVVWAYTTDPDRTVTLTPLGLLAPREVYRCGLDVYAERLLGAIPVSWTFAMRAPPPGSPVPTPDSLRDWLTHPHRIAAAPAEFERLIRSALAGRRPVAPAAAN